MKPERYLFSFVVSVLAFNVASKAQVCIDPARQHLHKLASAPVSATTLRLPIAARKHFEKAREAARGNQPDIFEREATATLAIAPDFAEVYVVRAMLQVHNGLNEEAIRSIATARTLQPEIPLASIVVASALTHMARYDEAAADLDRFHFFNENWQWEFEKTRAELGRHNISGALHWSQLTEEDAPEGCPDSHLLRINALEMAGLKREAIPEMEAYLASGKRLPQQDAVQRLLEQDRKVLDENPGSQDGSR